ncbi:MAG: VOC family protein [Alphaproteobacteria bacterium]|nr:VOC family protein [Alphaproteobacteria bacterium]
MTRLAAVTFLVRDYDEAIAWFQRVLNFELLEDTDLGGGKRWVLMGARKSMSSNFLLAKAASAEQLAHVGKAAGGRVAYFLHSLNFGNDHARMVAAGVIFNEAPRHEAYGIVAVFQDLYGNLWDLIEPKVKL